ncbi:hypothetical protein NKH18_18485 [Streptomyces sp. M10(2022)]
MRRPGRGRLSDRDEDPRRSGHLRLRRWLRDLVLDLTNTTSETCHAIHPVLVLTDEDRKLTSEQVQLEFSEGANPDEQHRVVWETTDRDEQIGVFGDGERTTTSPASPCPPSAPST